MVLAHGRVPGGATLGRMTGKPTSKRIKLVCFEDLVCFDLPLTQIYGIYRSVMVCFQVKHTTAWVVWFDPVGAMK